MSRTRLALLSILPSVAGCVRYDRQSALDPAGPQAGAIHGEFQLMLVVAAVVYLVVITVFLLVARHRTPPDEVRSPEREARARRTIQVAVGVTVVILFGVLVYDLALGRRIMFGQPNDAVRIHLIGHQWWWEVEYEDPVPQNQVTTANEIHIPVGKPVQIRLDARDVIHSLWIPNLGGKKDLIPGQHNTIWLQADKPGIYRGQCAEFCGLQHAKMALFVVAESPAQYTAWLEGQRAPPPAPADSVTARGRDVFESGPCVVCHTIRSTEGAGRVGPDLTHLGSRLSLAAGVLNNTTGNLGGWIADPQSIKPGANMPPNALASTDLRALIAYLRTLK
jgi:cytochrome c oxidase subunit 2